MTTISTIEITKVKDAKKRYDFFLNGEKIASLDYPKRFSKAAIMQAGDKQWNISRKGWWIHWLEISADHGCPTRF